MNGAGRHKGTLAVSDFVVDDGTLSDSDQTLADTDQTVADSDQSAADDDQAAADKDQAASDRDLAHGGDPDEHDLTRDARNSAARQRDRTANTRLVTAAARDEIANSRDQAAAVRDHEAALHAGERNTAGAMRASAAEGRARALSDREQAAADRAQAAGDRVQAQADCDALLHQLALAETDEVTGTRTRAAGLADLEHEVDRARRTTGQLVVAYVDVVGLKTVNDTDGHAAGDGLLQRAVRVMRAHLRSYDLVIRMGGDEFLCVLSDATIPIAGQRFAAVQSALAAEADPCEIRVGIAALAPNDTAGELIRRADAELPAGSGR